MKQIEIRRKDDVIRLKSGEYFRMQEGDVIVQPRGKKWDNNEYSEEVVLFGENGFEINR
jgi:gentisate 1,2-dioxygenase